MQITLVMAAKSAHTGRGMKRHIPRSLAAVVCVVGALAALAPAVHAQSITGIGRKNTGADIGPQPVVPKTETTVTVKLGPVRNWKDTAGKEISAELISWPVTDANAANAAKADPATLKFDVIRNGQVRLRKAGKVFVLPVSRLSESDRAYISQVEATTKKDK